MVVNPEVEHLHWLRFLFLLFRIPLPAMAENRHENLNAFLALSRESAKLVCEHPC
jgi:hypothetical protein